MILFDLNTSFLGVDKLLFLALPLIIFIAFAFKKTNFIWFYFIFSLGTIIYYILNALEPNMSLRLNLYVIIENLLILIFYFWYINRKFKEDYLKSIKHFKFWLLDFDKKEAFWALSPLFAILMVMVAIAYKFKNVIFARIF